MQDFFSSISVHNRRRSSGYFDLIFTIIQGMGYRNKNVVRGDGKEGYKLRKALLTLIPISFANQKRKNEGKKRWSRSSQVKQDCSVLPGTTLLVYHLGIFPTVTGQSQVIPFRVHIKTVFSQLPFIFCTETCQKRRPR